MLALHYQVSPVDEQLDVPVYIVDDDKSVRESLRYMLEGYGFTVFDFAGGDDFLTSTDISAGPGCLILDSKMPGISGQEVHDQLNKLGATFSIIFLTGHGDTPMAVRAFREGAKDFFQKPTSADELIPSIRKAQKNSILRYQKHANETLFSILTGRERELFQMVVEGLLNKQIADRLCISLRTVEVHRSKMMLKIHAENITDVVKFYDSLKSEL